MGCDWSRNKDREPPPAPVLVYVGDEPRLTIIANNYEMLREKNMLTRFEHSLPRLFADLAKNVTSDAQWHAFFTSCRAMKIGYRIVN